MNAIDKAKEIIRATAEEDGDTIIHMWDIDLQDGTSNVKAIIQPKTGSSFTTGVRVENTPTS